MELIDYLCVENKKNFIPGNMIPEIDFAGTQHVEAEVIRRIFHLCSADDENASVGRPLRGAIGSVLASA